MFNNVWHDVKRIYVEFRLKMSCLYPDLLKCDYKQKTEKGEFLKGII